MELEKKGSTERPCGKREKGERKRKRDREKEEEEIEVDRVLPFKGTGYCLGDTLCRVSKVQGHMCLDANVLSPYLLKG